MSRKQLTVCN